MNIRIIARNYEPSDKLKLIIEKKLAKLDRFFYEEPEAIVTLRTVKKECVMEVTISCGTTIIRAEKPGKTFYYAVDDVLSVLEKQIIKNRSKLQQRVKVTEDLMAEPTADEEAVVVKVKSFAVKPMDASEAILQMELTGHDFYLFRNSSTENFNVVYKRKDGGYGLLEPQ